MDRQTFLARMRPMAAWAARRRAFPHPYGGAEDLFQDALETLLRVWRQHHATKAPEDLCRLGRVAVLRRLDKVRAHAYAHGEGAVSAWLDLDQPLHADTAEGAGGLRLVEVLGAEGIEDIFFWFGLQELESSLDTVGRAVLGELLDPGERTLRAIRRVWRARASRTGSRWGNWWAKHRQEVLACGLRLEQPRVRVALRQIRARAADVFSFGEKRFPVYRSIVGRAVNVHFSQEGAVVMDKKKNGGFVPSESDLGLPEPGDIESVKGSEPTTVESPKTTAASPAKAKKTAPQVTKKATPQAEKKAASQAPKKAAPPAKAKKAAPPAKAKKAGNGRSALADEMKVCAAVDARKGTIREKLQAFCKTPITVAALVEKAKGVRNVRGKVRSMLKKGTLKQA